MNNQVALFTKFDNSKAAIRDIRNYLAGRAMGITRDEALLDEIIKILFSLRDINFNFFYEDSYQNAKIIRSKFAETKESFPDFFDKNDEIMLDPESLNYTIKIFEEISYLNQEKIDIVNDCYEIFIGNHIRGQEGQFFTPKVAVDFLIEAVRPQPNWKIIDTACGACGFLSATFMYFKKNYSDDIAIKSLKNNIYGIDKDQYLSRLGKIHLSLLGGVNANIFNGDSLSFQGIEKKLMPEKFDLIITNPPFGAKINAASVETLRDFSLGYKWKLNGERYINTKELSSKTPPQVLFMERNIDLLKDGGVLATVVPESLLSNKNYKYVIQHLFGEGTIESVVGMPESLFKTSGKSGTHTKTCLLIFKKSRKQNDYPIFFAEAKWCGHDSRANIIPHNDIPDVLNNYKQYCADGLSVQSSLGYSVNRSEIEDNILAPRYYDIDFKCLKNKVEKNNYMFLISELVEKGVLEIKTGDEVGKLAYGTGDVPYIRTSDISNWEVKVDVKHCINDTYYNQLSAKQDIQAGDIFMVKDGTYLIGSLAIITNADIKSVYQSHIYKIRVLPNDLNITSYILLAMLSSDFVQRQIKSKQLTQDIIDSLGKRIFDLVIPIPKQKSALNKVHNNVKELISLKENIKNNYGILINSVNSRLT